MRIEPGWSFGAGGPAAAGVPPGDTSCAAPAPAASLSAAGAGQALGAWLARARRSHRRIQPEPREAPAGYYLGGRVVDPHYRRRGIGEALTQARMDWVYEVADEVWYFTSATNAASIAMHSRLGFTEVTCEFFFPGVTFTSGQGILFRATAQSRNGT